MHIDAEARQGLQRVLAPDEHLLWAGRPVQGLRMQFTDVFVVPLSLAWTAGVVFSEATVLRSGMPAAFALFGAPFVLAGVFLLVGRFFWDAHLRARTSYGVTDQRVLLVHGESVTSLPLRTLPPVTVRRATVTFGTAAGRAPAPAFDHVPDAASVAELIRRAAARS